MSKLSFLQFMQERDQLDEAFNSAPYELTMGKKNAGDVFFTFIDEDEKEYRIQFYTPQGLGKSVRQVFIGQKRGSVYPDAIARFKNPMRVIASMIEATKQFMATPLGKTIDGFAVNFSKKALDRGMTLIPKIIRQSGLKQKLNVMDLTYAPVPDRGYVWLVRKGKDPAQVFDGPKMQGITWDDPDKVGDVPVQNSVDGVVGGTGQTIVVGVDFRSEMEDLDISVSGNDITVMDGRKLVVSFTDPETARIISGMKTPSAAITNFMQKTNPGRYTGNIKVNSTSTRSGKKYEFIASDSSGKQLFNLNVEDSRKTNLGTGAGSSEIEVNREWYNSSDTGLKLKSGRDPIRGNYVRLISGSKEVAAFYGYDFDKYPDGTEVSWNMKRGFTNQDLVGASMTKQKKGMYDQYTFKKGAQIILVVDVDTSNDTSNDNGWKLTKADATQPMLVWAGKEKGRLVTANIAPHYNEPGVYVGAYMNEKPVRGQSADFITRQLKLPQVPINILNDFTTASTKFWKGSQNSSDRNNPANIIGSGTAVIDAKRLGAREVNVERFKNGVRMRSQNGDVDISISDPDFSNAASATDAATASVVVKNGRYEGAINSKRKIARTSNEQGTEWDIIGVNGETLVSIKLNKVSKSASDSTEGATSVDQLRDSGFIARVLGIIDTNVGLDTSILPGENIRRVGAGRYTTAGGLVIVVNFTNVLAGFVQYSVFSEIAEEENVAKGSARDVANAVIASIFEVAKTQYTGKWEISAVPTSAPYPIKAIRRSRGWGYVETANWTLTVSDAVLNRVKPGKTALLELIKEPPRGKHPLEIIPEKGDKTLMLKDRITGAIYGSIDLNAQGADLVNSGTLKMPRNAMVFGETDSGFSIRWDVNFPETGKYAGTSMITNVTYYYDKGKVAFTPIVSQKGRTLNNPKTYELTLNKDVVQSMIDEISSRMEYLSRNLQQLKSQSYNPNQVFLNDITITDKGEVIWNDYNLSDGKVTQIMLSMISAENKRLEKVANTPDINITLPKKQAEVVEFINRMIDIDLTPYVRTPKKRDVVLFDSSELSMNQLNNIERLGRETGKWSLQPNGGMGHALLLKSTSHNPKDDLAAYADSIRDNAPKGRDLDWQIYASRDGQTLNVDWDITFRRNTTEGAYREFKAQIDRANQYLQTLYRDAKSKGYNPTEPNLMTLDSAQQSDQWARDYGEGAYSEYEQSLGGNMQIKI